MTRWRELQNELLRVVSTVASECELDFTKRGLTIEAPKVSEMHEAEDCEVEIQISRGGDLVDIVEFHFVRGGVPVLDASDLLEWLRTTLADVLRRDDLRGSGAREIS